MKTNIETEISGFNFGGKQIFFVEAKGRDISFERWRVCLYYAPCMALTEFFATERAYNEFIAEARKHTFTEYSEYRKSVQAA